MNTVLFVFRFLAAIIEMIKALEEAAPLPGKGAEKLAYIREVLEILLTGLKDVNIVLAIELVTKFVNLTVKLFNSLGVFVKLSGGAARPELPEPGVTLG